MQFEGAVIKEQGVTFGILVVKEYVLNSLTETQDAMNFGTRAFGPMPVVLMAQDHRGMPRYKGRKDIVNFLANVHPSQIPWRKYTIE
jgi:hypothetical protein